MSCKSDHKNTQKLKNEWAKLEELGVPLEPSEHRIKADNILSIEQQHDCVSNMLTEIRPGVTACILDLNIVCKGPGKVIPRSCTLDLPWASTPVQWLPHTDSAGRKVEEYKLDPTLVYWREEVINHRILGERALRPGDAVSGLLLGVSYEPIPPECGPQVRLRFRIVDQHDRVHAAQPVLWVCRSSPQAKGPDVGKANGAARSMTPKLTPEQKAAKRERRRKYLKWRDPIVKKREPLVRPAPAVTEPAKIDPAKTDPMLLEGLLRAYEDARDGKLPRAKRIDAEKAVPAPAQPDREAGQSMARRK
jgi:hypothetical protein